ncbi:hypothetical protein HDV06_005534 [Boothiomyces sp. JEL0866]|nr:hypothetical protein HDV06_005534 [Boothiomyces sp. JEL0866]
MLNIEVIDKKCILAGSDLRIYELSPQPKLVQINTEFPLISCISSQSALTALGFASGQIKLVKTSDTSLVNDLGTKASRNCNVVKWSTTKKNILLSGLDKAKNEFGLLFWDINNTNAVLSKHGSSQGVTSASWLNSSDTVVAGMGKQLIRGYDLRDNPDASPIFTISTKAVHGICSDPFTHQRFASFAEDGIIKVWDTRKISEAILTVNSDFRFGIGGIAWCCTRSGVLSGFGKESPIARLWEMDSVCFSSQSGVETGISSSESQNQFEISPNNTEIKSTVIFRTRTVKLSDLNINNFVWLPKSASKSFGYPLLLCSGKELRLEPHQIPPIRFSSWSPKLNLSASENSKILHYSSTIKDAKSRVEDISETMHSRAVQGYALKVEQNLHSIKFDEHLKCAWRYVYALDNLPGNLKADQSVGILGLQQMLISMPESQGFNMKIYKNRARDLALYLCGWHYRDPEVDHLKFQETIRKIEYDGEFEKAAGLTFLYYADLSKTIECLNASRNERLMLVAAALAGGFGNLSNDSDRNIWKSLCKNLSYQLADPYLRAMFGIMSSEGNWNLVLAETSLPLYERMIMALLFLNDQELNQYVSKWTSRVTEQGRIDGLLLTGWTTNCLNLMEKYVDKTGDIQSVLFAIIRSMGALSYQGGI